MRNFIIFGAFIAFFYGLYALNHISLSGGYRQPGPLWYHIWLEVPVAILPSLIIIQYGDVKGLSPVFFGVEEGDFTAASLAILYGVIGYFFFLTVFDRIFRRIFSSVSASKNIDHMAMALAIFLIQFMLLTTLFFLLQYRIPILGIFSGEDINVLRKQARLQFKGPIVSVTSSVLVLSDLGMVYLAVLRSRYSPCWVMLVLLISSSIGLLWSGAKGPFVIGILLHWFAYRWFLKKPLSLLALTRATFIALVLAIAIFSMVLLGQNFSELVDYFWIRLFLGQTSGFFQTIALVEPDKTYMLAWIPFGGFLFDNVPEFARDLMINTLGDTETSGTKNTIYLGEAYGVGGWGMLFASPFIVAVSVVLSLHIIRVLFFRLVGREYAECGMFVFVANLALTSGMAGFVGFRALIFVSVILFVVAIVYKVLVAAKGASKRQVVATW